MDELVEVVLPRLPPVLMDELIEEVLLRLPPDEPAWLVRSSAVCKPWRRILASPRFRRRYREFHGTPPRLLLGYFDFDTSFVPSSALLPALPGRPGRIALDCRHGRALFAPYNGYGDPFEFIVLDPVTGHESRVASPVHDGLMYSASVVCATQGCDHHACQHFLVALVSTECLQITSGWLYSSETGVWSEFTSLHHPHVKCPSHMAWPSVLVGDSLYFFNIHRGAIIIKCHLGTLSFSMLKKPTYAKGCLITAEDGGLGFAAVVEIRNLTLWSMETRPEGAAMGWARTRVLDLETVLPSGALSIPDHLYGMISMSQRSSVGGFAEGTQLIFVSTYVGFYMVDLKSGLVKTVSYSGVNIRPYVRFYFPAMEAAASTDQEQ